MVIFKAVIRPALLYGYPLYWELYISTLVNIQQFENRLLRTIVMGTALQRNRTRFIRDTLKISTVLSYITQRQIKFFHAMRHLSSPLFSVIRAPTRTAWHRSRIIDITQQYTDYPHQLGFLWQHCTSIQRTTHSVTNWYTNRYCLFFLSLS